MSGEAWLFDVILSRFKEAIPAAGRSYNSNRRHWSIDPRYSDRLQAWIRAMENEFDSEICDEQPAPDPPVSDPCSDPYEVLRLLPTAPPQLVEGAYRILAQICHPDHAGGDGEAMRQINVARDKILEMLQGRSNEKEKVSHRPPKPRK